MRTVELRVEGGRSIARRVSMACSFKARCIGLLRHRALHPEEGLLLIPGGSIHTLAMRFAIDVVFLDRQLRVIGLLTRLAPWRFAFAPTGTQYVLELPAGRIAQADLTLSAYVCLCFDDETDEVCIPGRRRRNRDSIVRPRPSSPCIEFSLHLPARSSPRIQHLRAFAQREAAQLHAKEELRK